MKKLLCYGDSNTFGYDPRSWPGGRYPEDVRWTGLLRTAYSVTEAGQNGREIPRREPELMELRQLLERESPDVLTVMLGTNDLLQSPHFTAADTAARMEHFLHALPLTGGTRVLLIAPPPMVPGTWVTEARLTEQSALLSSCYQALSGRLGIAFADAGAWGAELLFDGVHFSPAGHHAFAAGLSKALAALF